LDVQRAEDNLKSYLAGTDLHSSLNTEVRRKLELEKLMKWHASNDWELKQSNKGICFYIKPVEEQSPPIAKIKYRIKSDMKHMYDCIKNFAYENLVQNVVKAEIIETFDETHIDIYTLCKLGLVLNLRDFVTKRWSAFDPQCSTFTSYSIIREDRPTNKGIVRAQILASSWILLVDETDKDFLVAEYYYQADIKGALPSWMMSKRFEAHLKGMHRFRKLVEGTTITHVEKLG